MASEFELIKLKIPGGWCRRRGCRGVGAYRAEHTWLGGRNGVTEITRIAVLCANCARKLAKKQGIEFEDRDVHCRKYP